MRGKEFLQIECGEQSNYVLTTEHEIYSWGANQFGQLGYTSEAVNPTPTLVQFEGAICKVSAGKYHAGFISDNHVYTFGHNKKG